MIQTTTPGTYVGLSFPQVTDQFSFQYYTSLGTGTWYHFLMVWDIDNPSNDPTWYLDGIDQGAPDTTGGSGSGGFPTGLDTLALGNSPGGATPGSTPDFRLADFAIFNSDPGQAGATALASGVYNPAQVDLANLIFYTPLRRWDEPDLMGAGIPSSQGVNFGTIEHPPIQQAIIPVRHGLTYPSDKLFSLAYVAPNTPSMYATATMDPALGFLEKDAANRPTALAGGAMVSCVGGVNSREIGMIYIGDASGDDPYFALFNMDTQTWDETDDQIEAVTASAARAGIVWRPIVGEYVVVYNGDQVSSQDMAWFSRRTGASTWSTPVALFTGTPSDDCYLLSIMPGANDMVHVVLEYNGGLYMRTINADNTLNAWPTAFTSGSTYEGVARGVRYEE